MDEISINILKIFTAKRLSHYCVGFEVPTAVVM
jgi:hypothetical protein